MAIPINITGAVANAAKGARVVDQADLKIIVDETSNYTWGQDNQKTDINEDGAVDGEDLEFLKQAFGAVPDECLPGGSGPDCKKYKDLCLIALEIYSADPAGNPPCDPAVSACASRCAMSYAGKDTDNDGVPDSPKFVLLGDANIVSSNTPGNEDGVDFDDLAYIKTYYLRGHGANARPGFSAVDYTANENINDEDKDVFGRGKLRCLSKENDPQKQGQCYECDDSGGRNDCSNLGP